MRSPAHTGKSDTVRYIKAGVIIATNYAYKKMPNPAPKTSHLVSGRTDTDVITGPLDPKSFAVRVTPPVAEAIRALPDKAAWLRRVVTEAAKRELIADSED